MWTNEQIEQAQTRSGLCESVTLTRDSYLELLDTALLAKGAVALGAERTMRVEELESLLEHILNGFSFQGHPGEACHRTGWVRDEILAKWRGVLNRK